MPNVLESVFLKACRLEKTPYTPVWLMRQAGRYMKDYRKIREKTPFLELCKNADLAAEITITAQQKLGVDAAILFSDILLILEPMGAQLEYVSGDGPSIRNPVRSTADVDRLLTAEASSLDFVYAAIRGIKKGLAKEIPLIGFAGAPFTLASYIIEGGSAKDFSRTKAFMHEDPERWRVLMKKITDGTAAYLNAQIEAGADAVQLFDSWAGVLTPEEYRNFALPHTRGLVQEIKRSSRVPVIHFGTRTSAFLESFAEAGADVVGVDHRIGLDEAWKRIGSKAIQGNLDPLVLLTDHASIEKEVKKILAEAAGRPGHIFNLGHGVLPETPFENVKALVQMVHAFSAKEEVLK